MAPKLAGVSEIPMLARVSVFPWLILAGLSSAMLAPGIEEALSFDALLLVFAKFGFADLYQMSQVSKELCGIAYYVLQPLYGIEHNRTVRLSYTKLVLQFETLVQDAGKAGSIPEAIAALESSSDYLAMQSVLEGQFGYCVRYSAGELPRFCLHDFDLSILSDEHKISVLPYALDHMKFTGLWPHFIRGLARARRLDLLSQITFSNIDSELFRKLLQISLPKSVMIAAIKSLHKNEPTIQLPELLTMAGLESETAPLFESRRVSLFHLRYFLQNNITVPESVVLVDGLEELSLQFWGPLFAGTIEKISQVLALISRHGDSMTKRLADMFVGPVSVHGLNLSERDAYQALLVFFRFSPLCSAGIVENYNRMFGASVVLGYQTIMALLIHEQLGTIQRSSIVIQDFDLESLIIKLFQLADTRLNPILLKCLRQCNDAPEMLKDFVKRNADDPHAQLVWQAIQSTIQPREIPNLSCSVPLSTLKLILCEGNISVGDVQRLLGTLDSFYGFGAHMTKEARILYTLMFWEASETVISYFLAQLSAGYELAFGIVLNVVKMTKYSDDLCGSLIGRIGGKYAFQERERILQYRPSLRDKASSLEHSNTL